MDDNDILDLVSKAKEALELSDHDTDLIYALGMVRLMREKLEQAELELIDKIGVEHASSL